MAVMRLSMHLYDALAFDYRVLRTGFARSKEVYTNTMTSLDRWQRTLEPFAGVGFDRGAAGAIAGEVQTR